MQQRSQVNAKKIEKRGENFVVTLPKAQATMLANEMWTKRWGTIFTYVSPLFGKRYSFVHLTEDQIKRIPLLWRKASKL